MVGVGVSRQNSCLHLAKPEQDSSIKIGAGSCCLGHLGRPLMCLTLPVLCFQKVLYVIGQVGGGC